MNWHQRVCFKVGGIHVFASTLGLFFSNISWYLETHSRCKFGCMCGFDLVNAYITVDALSQQWRCVEFVLVPASAVGHGVDPSTRRCCADTTRSCPQEDDDEWLKKWRWWGAHPSGYIGGTYWPSCYLRHSKAHMFRSQSPHKGRTRD
jgi:hypothetical protein